MSEIPQSHIDDANSLTADGIVSLYHIILRDGSNLYLKSDNDATWQGNVYEGVGIKMGEVSNSSDATEASRPQLIIANPLGVFSSFAASGNIDRAEVRRYRLLRQHLIDNRNIYTRQSWKVMRIVSMGKRTLTVELRNQLDGPNFVTPARMFLAPEFPSVTI